MNSERNVPGTASVGHLAQRLEYRSDQDGHRVGPCGAAQALTKQALVEDDARQSARLPDTTAQAARRALRESEERFREIAESIPDVFYSRAPDASRVFYLSPAFEALWGCSRATIYERPLLLFDQVRMEDRPSVRAALARQSGGQSTSIVYRLDRNDGSRRWIRDDAHPIRDVEGTVIRVVGTARDITAYRQVRRQLQRERRKLAYIAQHDDLTGAYNRTFLASHVPKLLAEARASGARLGVIFIDIDEFKMINDSRGHRAGDLLLRRLVSRLRRTVSDRDLIVRTGGDEFVAIVRSAQGQRAVEDAAAGMLRALRAPIRVNGEVFCVTASMGISVCPEDGTDLEALLQNADIALYQQKALGKDGVRRFTRHMHAEIQKRAALLQALQQALRGGHLSLEYQPILDLRTGRTAGLEGLVRWRDPTFNQVPPSVFIGLAEKSGLGNELGMQVLRMACRQLREWRDAGLPVVPVSVNLSPPQFERGELTSFIPALLSEFSLEPGSLTVEITEGIAMDHGGRTLATLNALRELGVRIAIDDFGTGYSSLSYLRDLPVDTLKIDRSFIGDIGGDSKATEIVAAIVRVAQTLGLKTVAEGVETLAQLKEVRDLGCDAVQGYYLSRPLTSHACREHLHQLAAGNFTSLATPWTAGAPLLNRGRIQFPRLAALEAT